MIHMRVRKLINEIHRNAVEHGWWDEERDKDEIIALIHSEWSEALEEARSGNPMLWYGDGMKPEGIAVELIDGAIRIFDYVGRIESRETIILDDPTDDDIYAKIPDDDVDMTLPKMVAHLHYRTSMALLPVKEYVQSAKLLLYTAFVAMKWIMINGQDPAEVLRIKHEYNMTRPYKHGKKF